jgi:hypothetical protein
MEESSNSNNLTSTERAPQAVPWTKRDLLWATGLGVAAVVTLLLFLAAGLFAYRLATGSEPPQSALGFLTLIAELGLLVPVWVFGVHKYRLSWAHVGFRRFSLARGLALGCLFLLLSLGIGALWSIFLALFGEHVQPDLLPLFGQARGGLLLALLAGGLVAPLAEEAFFRGYLFPGLRKYLGLLPATLLSAAIFALAHILPTSWPPIFVLGVLFALLYEQTGSILPAVFMHSAINTLSFLSSYLLTTVQR